MDTPITRAEHEEFRKRIDEENHRQNRRIEILEKGQEQNSKMIASVEKLALNMENMLKEQERQGKRLEVLENRDGDTWRKVKWYILTLAIGVIAGIIFTQIGLQ